METIALRIHITLSKYRNELLIFFEMMKFNIVEFFL